LHSVCAKEHSLLSFQGPVRAFNMRWYLVMMMVAVAGCAAKAPAPPITAEQHAANIAAAQQAGYKVVAKGDHTLFCPTAAPTGSHMGPTCITERDFESLMGRGHSTLPTETVLHTSPGPGPGSGH
jgi:hypothetical protein